MRTHVHIICWTCSKWQRACRRHGTCVTRHMARDRIYSRHHTHFFNLQVLTHHEHQRLVTVHIHYMWTQVRHPLLASMRGWQHVFLCIEMFGCLFLTGAYPHASALALHDHVLCFVVSDFCWLYMDVLSWIHDVLSRGVQEEVLACGASNHEQPFMLDVAYV